MRRTKERIENAARKEEPSSKRLYIYTEVLYTVNFLVASL